MEWDLRKRSLAVVLGAISLAACASTTGGSAWGGPGLHAVDGYWMLGELSCELTSAGGCATDVALAEAALGIDPQRVVRAATAGLPKWRFVASDGQVHVVLRNTTGSASFVILDLADGSRRVMGVACWGVPNEDGSMNCGAGPFDDYRVGATPSF